MDANYLLMWMVGIACAMTLAQLARLRMPGTMSQSVTAGLLLAVLGVGWFVFPDIAGYVAAGGWLVMAILPAFGARKLTRLLTEDDYEGAAMLARKLRWFYPFDDWKPLIDSYTASAYSKAGSPKLATEILERYRDVKSPRARSAVAQLYRLQERWADFLEWDASLSDIGAPDLGMSMVRLRALGETGRWADFLAAYESFERRFQSADLYRNIARLYVAAFFGRGELALRLMNGPLRRYNAATRERWLTTAWIAQTRTDIPAAVRDQAAGVIAGIENEITHEVRYGARSRTSRPIVTYIFFGLNVAMFCAETALGGSTNTDTVMKLGGLVPALLTPSESWRLLAASFLHFGWLHIGSNMLGLYVLGPFVEKLMGRWRYAVCYVGAGIGSMGIVVIASRFGLLNYDIVAGASGSVMGLVGATAAIALRDSRVLKTQASLMRLRSAGTIIVAQFLFDAATPQVSMTAHLGGAATGFVLTLLMSGGK